MRLLASLSKGIYQNRQQRRNNIKQAQAILAQSENLLTAAIFFIVFIFPFLINPSLLFDLTAWLWWVKGHVWLCPLSWAAIRFLVTVPLVPAQMVSATVDAMEQATPPDEPTVSILSEPVEIECISLSKPPDTAEQKAGRQDYWRQQWRRPGRRLLFGIPIRRHLPLPSLSFEPAA